ncbi:hypothetical protein [Candidatus Methylacidithermus pantelleriae]|uniref:hypothetical protein n=1 Tax=Candidatus Methylacidithermus pantelleriae TaxID=2744239 RepID=UPI00157CBB9C|nr:hypothetical protein [Candidatus Methylacidithermus pantelleriae]
MRLSQESIAASSRPSFPSAQFLGRRSFFALGTVAGLKPAAGQDSATILFAATLKSNERKLFLAQKKRIAIRGEKPMGELLVAKKNDRVKSEAQCRSPGRRVLASSGNLRLPLLLRLQDSFEGVCEGDCGRIVRDPNNRRSTFASVGDVAFGQRGTNTLLLSLLQPYPFLLGKST